MNMEYTDKNTLNLIKPRKEDGSKGDFGTLVTLCGCETMTGAAALSSYAALRSGLGLLRFSGNEETIKRMQTIIYEPVFTPINSIFDNKYTAFLCGCGIGRTYDDILSNVLLNCRMPAVLDADCINFIAENIDILNNMNCEKILTPHPGEMARLCKTDIAHIQNNRIETAIDFAKQYNCTLILKGKNTVIAHKDGKCVINTSGSDALSTGGSGDVLAGVIASLIAQGYNTFDASVLGVYVHGLAADNLAKTYGKSGVLPSDLPKEIGHILG